MRIFSKYFRGFEWIDVDLRKLNFLVGDNSSGKSSILHLVNSVANCDLSRPPAFEEDYGVDPYDYFSPFFNYRDVIFGYSVGSGDDEFTKIVTVKRNRGFGAKITRCSYFKSGHRISFRIRDGVVLYKASRYVDLNSKKMVEIHGDASGFQELQKETYASLGSEVFLTSLVVKKNESLLDLVEEMQSSILPYARIVSPVRALPEKFYMHRRKNNAQGLHFASIWMLFNKSKKNNQYLKDIDQFGVDSGLFEKLSVKGVSSKFPDSPLIVEVQRNGKKLFVNQVGVGVSQVVPVLIDTVFALKAGGKIVLLQQPELHLHPVAQAALGSYLFKVAREGLCGVVETHSSYLLDRFRADLRDCNNADGGGFTGGVQMLFCESGPKGNQIHEVGVGKSGQLIGEPDRYHQFFIDEYVRTMF